MHRFRMRNKNLLLDETERERNKNNNSMLSLLVHCGISFFAISFFFLHKMQNTIDPVRKRGENYVYRFIYLLFCIDFICSIFFFVVHWLECKNICPIGDSLHSEAKEICGLERNRACKHTSICIRLSMRVNESKTVPIRHAVPNLFLRPKILYLSTMEIYFRDNFFFTSVHSIVVDEYICCNVRKLPRDVHSLYNVALYLHKYKSLTDWASLTNTVWHWITTQMRNRRSYRC